METFASCLSPTVIVIKDSRILFHGVDYGDESYDTIIGHSRQLPDD